MSRRCDTLAMLWCVVVMFLWSASALHAEDVTLDFTFLTPTTFSDTNQPYEAGKGVRIESYSDPVSFYTGSLETCSEPYALKNGFAGEMGCSDGDILRFYLQGYTSDRISVNVGISESIFGDDITATLKGYANVDGSLVEIGGLAPVSIYLGSGVQHISDNVLVLEDPEGRIGAFTVSYGPNCEVEKVDCVNIHVWEGDDPPPPDDPDPPVVTITSPENGAEYGRSMVMVTGIVEESVGLTDLRLFIGGGGYRLDITGQSPPEYRFAKMIPIDEGDNEIRVRAIDVGEHEVTESVTVRLNPYPPPPPDPPASLDFEATGMEVTQGIQGWEMIHYTDYVNRDTARLIGGKKTLVRVYAEAKGTTVDMEGVRCRLEGFRGGPAGTPLPGSPMDAIAPVTLAAGEDYVLQREDLAKSFNFILPESWTEPGITTLVATVNDGQPIRERTGRYDALNSHFKDVRFHDTEELCVFMYRIYKGGEQVPGLDDCYHNLSYLERAYPVVPSKLNIVDAGIYHHPSRYNLSDSTDLSRALKRFRRYCGFYHGRARVEACVNESYIGLTHDTNRHRGVTHYKFPVSLGCASTDSRESRNVYYRKKSAHEVGHAQGLGHVNSFSDDCSYVNSDGDHEPKDPYESYPVQRDPTGAYYDQASIGQWGVDILDDNTLHLKSPWDYGDLMSYCGNRWLSIRIWERLAGKFGAEVPEPAAAISFSENSVSVPATADLPLTTRHLVIEGLFISDNAAEMYPAWQDDFKTGAYDDEGKGEYTITLLGKADNILFTRKFDREFIYDLESYSLFSEIVPFAAGTRKICLSGPSGFKGICMDAGPSIPQVTLNYPNGGESFPATGVQQVYWSGSDADGDSLVYALYYSRDSGDSWQMVDDEIEATGANVSLDELPGAKAQCLFKVVATDGINQGEDVSDAVFSKDNLKPTVKIISPRPIAVFKRKEPVFLTGMASDREDLRLAESEMNWYSDNGGYLGSGKNLVVDTLASGMHEISFKGNDMDGASAKDKTRIYIEPTPFADITDAGSGGPVMHLPSGLLKIRCALDAAEDVIDGDWWLFVRTPSGSTYFWYDEDWTGQEIPWRQGKIEDFGPSTVMEPAGDELPESATGAYVFFFGVDTVVDGDVNWSDFYYDSLTVEIMPCIPDTDTDGDVDGKDLYAQALSGGSGCIDALAGRFGAVDQL